MSKAFYENLFASGRDEPWNDAPGKKVLLAWLADAPQMVRPDILDVGCGSGYFANAVAGLLGAADCHGCDISEVALARARSSYPHLAFAAADAGHLPYQKAAFDVVVSYGVFEHLPEPQAAIAEAARVLRQEGIFAFLMPTVGHYRDDRSDEGWYADLNDPPQMQWNFTRPTWEKMFASAGLALAGEDAAIRSGALRPGNFYFGARR